MLSEKDFIIFFLEQKHEMSFLELWEFVVFE